MPDGEPPEGWGTFLYKFLQRHFVRAKMTETKNRGAGEGAKKGNKREHGEAVAAKAPTLVPAHTPAADETRNGSRNRHRRPRRRRRRATVAKSPEDPSSALHPDGLIEPTIVLVAADDRTVDSPAPVVLADTDTEGSQEARKNRHGGRTERAAEGLALEHDALKSMIAEKERTPEPTVDDPSPSSAFVVVPTPNDAPRMGAVFPVPSNGWEKPKKPRARWSPIPSPPRLAPPTPPRRAWTPARTTRPRVAADQVQGDNIEEDEEDDGLGIKRMFDLEGQEVAQVEDNEREEEEEMHINYWIRNKNLKAKDKTLCLICYLERKAKVPEIANREDKVTKHLNEFHKIKRGHVCQRKGCWVTGRNKREIGIHQLLCHNM